MELIIILILGLTVFNTMMIIFINGSISRMERRPRPTGREDYEQ